MSSSALYSQLIIIWLGLKIGKLLHITEYFSLLCVVEKCSTQGGREIENEESGWQS